MLHIYLSRKKKKKKKERETVRLYISSPGPSPPSPHHRVASSNLRPHSDPVDAKGEMRQTRLIGLLSSAHYRHTEEKKKTRENVKKESQKKIDQVKKSQPKHIKRIKRGEKRQLHVPSSCRMKRINQRFSLSMVMRDYIYDVGSQSCIEDLYRSDRKRKSRRVGFV